ncbi:MAG: acyl carrier protein [Pseudomonadota bacterium]
MLERIKGQIVNTLVEHAKMAPADVKFELAIEEIGIKSVDAVYMCGVLEEEFGIEVDPALIFECETLDMFAHEISALVIAPR